jgi:hypothetical protein
LVNNVNSGLTINGNGGTTSGNGGTVSVVVNGGNGNGSMLTFGSIGLSISASAVSGNGGSVTINGASYALDLIGSGINVDGAGNGNGGTINVQTDNLLIVSGVLSANAEGSGLGGSITLTQTSNSANPMVLNGAMISASGDSAGSGGGGSVSISNAGNLGVLMPGTTVKANASQTGSSKGGSISITTPVILDAALDLTQNTSISATGAMNGPGGIVSIGFSLEFDVNSVVKVSAGSGVTDLTTFDGSIELNKVTCQQWLTGYDWPTSYWNCANPASPTDTESTPASFANGLPDSLQATLRTNDVVIYVHTNVSNYTSFFGKSIPSTVAGFTDTLGSPNFIYVALIENVQAVAGNFTQDPDQISETTAHEFGHALNISNSDQGASDAYNTSVQNDFLFLDYTRVGSSDATSVRRSACSSNNTGALDGILDESTGQLFCDSSTHILESKYIVNSVPFINSKILQLASVNSQIFLNLGGDDAWKELYAQTFAFHAYVANSGLSPANTLFPTANGVFGNGNINPFQCTLGWADALFDSEMTPPSPALTPYPTGSGYPASCASAVPTWYATQLANQ